MRELKPSLVPNIDTVGIVSENSAETDYLIKTATMLNSGLIVAKDIGDGDPERMSPPQIRSYVESLFKDSSIKIRVEQINKDNYPLFEAVNRAASDVERHRGCVMFLEYTPSDCSKIKDTLLFVGKGVTYDTGGADLKVNGVMAGMSRDKCGAAAVAGFMQVVNEVKPNDVKVIGALSLVRNSIGSNAYVADEVYKARSGAIVRATNTDAEGRMVMADVLCEVSANLLTFQLIPGATHLTLWNANTILLGFGIYTVNK